MSLNDTDFDIIFAGGGAAACLTAGRLAAADPALKILIVEAGPHTQEKLEHVQPARFLSHMVPDSMTMKFIVSNPSEHLDGRVTVAGAGQCVGGGSSVNFIMYTRAAASDYDDWETIYKNPGPLKVSWGGAFPNVAQNFLDVAAKYDKGRDTTDDPNDLFTVNVYARWPKWIDGQTGRRSDVPHHFLYTQQGNKNLHILTGSFVKRVVIRNGRAVGVEYVPNARLYPGASPEPVTVYAKKLVVVTGGSFGSPLILERSGIGAASILERFGVKQIVELPGVDHQGLAPLCRASEESETLDGLLRGDPAEAQKWGLQWAKDGSGMMATNGLDAGIKLRPNEAELRSIGPAFRAKWNSYYNNAPDKAILWFGCASFCIGGVAEAPVGKYYGCGCWLLHPSSMGHVHISSGEDPAAPPNWTPGYLEHEDDMELHVFGYKRGREFARRMACYRGEYAGQHPAYAKGSPAAVREDPTPVAIDAPEIHYTDEDNIAIRTFVKKHVSTTWHALGTCAMMPREEGGVVDPRLNVYGVEGLKVGDLSIAPYNVGANTYSTALVIAEKTAVIIGEEFGISGI
ncbi:hypothetical protein EUX98_g5304 [Antrodiella citrinella]|uniref:Glucose-methanol-choline oxidoreductase N-terminal domain-containing protein n=1 Tax=Antrodiella citrinella TaxID=2447956 RepID=A0A4S4MRR5_9APHY|nr:hypothetical protein EUX98_g5304 [Antrodiella citrinella]